MRLFYLSDRDFTTNNGKSLSIIRFEQVLLINLSIWSQNSVNGEYGHQWDWHIL